MLSVPSPSQKPGRGYPSRGGYLDRFFELGSKIVIRRCLKEGSWFRQDCIFRCCYSEVPQKRLFCAHETPLSQKARFVAILTGCGQRSQPQVPDVALSQCPCSTLPVLYGGLPSERHDAWSWLGLCTPSLSTPPLLASVY